MDRSSEYTDEDIVYTISDLCSTCRVEQSYVLELVSHGIIEPRDSSQSIWRFTAAEASRARSAYRLQRDLELNLEGVALALELIDQNRQLKERLHFLEQLMERLQQQR